MAFRNGLPLLDNHSSLLLLASGWLASCLVSWLQAGINTGSSIKSKLNKRIIAHLCIELCIGLTPCQGLLYEPFLSIKFSVLYQYRIIANLYKFHMDLMRQSDLGWTCMHKAYPCCLGHNVSLILLLFVFLQLCQRSGRYCAATISTPSSKCSLILQLCLLCTFRHYSFSPGSEPCKLRQSPGTHTQNSRKPELLDFNIRSMQEVGAITHRLPSSFCPSLHYKEDKCCDLLFWHSFDEDCVSAIRSTRKSFIRISDQV